ncbi:nitrogen assimilation transcriptional regulator NAC [Brooklawnia cerclae]|uniref:LysR family nitrogen assimilation transcriptional regulator n=1 Tax=Brooklawnia cerclae TaxID=349934 RepID=A0ABX0SHA6_9ACTN|nr:LysR substrate-binding domain-containing protein [Brooklawnia cerclae]NIH57778.1 LysR family nitrogen assimilation transcriptional regulator [Brooklawnia cerclae]
MDTRRLRYFVTIVDCGTITRAAEMLYLAQPALSQHVSALEAELGQQLLVRSHKGITPTNAGRSLYRYAQEILRLEESVQREIRSDDDSPSGTVAIGLASYSLASTMTVPLLQAIRSRYPRIVMRLVETLTVIHSQALRMGQIDAALIYDPGPVRGVRFERVSVDELYLVAPDWFEIPLDEKGDVPVAALGGLQFLLPSRTHTLRKLVEQAVHQADGELEVVIEIESTRLLADAVALGLGVTILPKPAAEALFPGDPFVLRRIVDPHLVAAFALATPDQQPLSAAAEAVVEVLREFTVPRPASCLGS